MGKLNTAKKITMNDVLKHHRDLTPKQIIELTEKIKIKKLCHQSKFILLNSQLRLICHISEKYKRTYNLFEEVEDLFQEAYCYNYQHLEKYDPQRRSLNIWVSRITVYCFSKLFTSKHARKRLKIQKSIHKIEDLNIRHKDSGEVLHDSWEQLIESKSPEYRYTILTSLLKVALSEDEYNALIHKAKYGNLSRLVKMSDRSKSHIYRSLDAARLSAKKLLSELGQSQYDFIGNK